MKKEKKRLKRKENTKINQPIESNQPNQRINRPMKKTKLKCSMPQLRVCDFSMRVFSAFFLWFWVSLLCCFLSLFRFEQLLVFCCYCFSVGTELIVIDVCLGTTHWEVSKFEGIRTESFMDQNMEIKILDKIFCFLLASLNNAHTLQR